MRVKATREGLVDEITASGYRIDRHVPFVALPDWKALYRAVKITNPLNGVSTVAIVLDVGPWNTDDHEYVFDGARPQAETGKDKSGRATNGAGIDLGERVWDVLKMQDNTEVEWEFL